MASRQKLLTPEESGSLKQAFTSLVDAMRFVQQLEKLSSKIREAREFAQKRSSSLDGLNGSLSGLIMSLKDSIGEAHATDLAKQISSFSSIAVEQVKRKIAEKSKSEIDEFTKSLDSEKTKTLKSIEAFLAVSPFPWRDEVLDLKLQDNAYEARSKYRCESNIEYEFSLDTRNEFFGKKFRLSNFVPEVRIPVRLAKNWLRKNPIPDFERLDQFFMVDAEATEKNLIANFFHEDGEERKMRIVYSKQDTNSFLSVEYASGSGAINVTATPDLNAHLDSEALKKAMERLWLAINELEKHKIALKRLNCENTEVLDKYDCDEFFRKSWHMIASRLSRVIKNSSLEDNAQRGENRLDESLIKEKLMLLGEDAKVIFEILDLKPQPQ